MNRQEADMWGGVPASEYYSQPSDGPRDAQGRRRNRDGSLVNPPQPAGRMNSESVDREVAELKRAVERLSERVSMLEQTVLKITNSI